MMLLIQRGNELPNYEPRMANWATDSFPHCGASLPASCLLLGNIPTDWPLCRIIAYGSYL